MERNEALAKILKMVTRAEHPDTPVDEAQTCRRIADKWMLDYAIQQAELRDADPVAERVPGDIVINTGGNDDVSGYVRHICGILSQHCRVQVRYSESWDREARAWMSKVYGWEGDLAYFEVLYTTVRLHMLGILAPRWDETRSDENNAYALHNAGYNWLEIASLRGWRKQSVYAVNNLHDSIPEVLYSKWVAGKAEVWQHKDTEEFKSNWQLGSWHKRACQRACEARGEVMTKISAGGSRNYRLDAASGYVDMISRRLREIRKEQDISEKGAVVLASAAQDLEDYVREQNPKDFTRCPHCEKLSASPYDCDRCHEHLKDRPEYKPQRRGRSFSYTYREVNEQAYAAGSAHARTADLGGRDRMKGQGQKGIGR